MNKLALAISITAKAFENKLDKGGYPYILHCLRVMNNTDGDECTKCAAVMHDLVEDTDEKSEINYTFELLTKLGFSDKTIGILHLVTHQKNTDYFEYIKAIAVSDDATKIKISDLRDNSDIFRLKGLGKKDLDRMEKYHRAYIYLSNR
jgi:(p)ppGpp synthase/HD superfamily hydrolase